MQDELDPEVAVAVRASFARQGLMTALGAEIVELGPGRCAVRVSYREALTQQQGFFHGGVVGAVGDTAGGYAAMTTVPPGREVVSAEYKINFLRPAVGDSLWAVGTVLRAGRSLTVVRVDVLAERDGTRQLCAALQQTVVGVAGTTG